MVAVLLVPAFADSGGSGALRDLNEQLSGAGLSVTRFERTGSRSGTGHGPYRSTRAVADVRAFVAANPGCVLLGHSLGARMVVAAASGWEPVHAPALVVGVCPALGLRPAPGRAARWLAGCAWAGSAATPGGSGHAAIQAEAALLASLWGSAPAAPAHVPLLLLVGKRDRSASSCPAAVRAWAAAQPTTASVSLSELDVTHQFWQVGGTSAVVAAILAALTDSSAAGA